MNLSNDVTLLLESQLSEDLSATISSCVDRLKFMTNEELIALFDLDLDPNEDDLELEAFEDEVMFDLDSLIRRYGEDTLVSEIIP